MTASTAPADPTDGNSPDGELAVPLLTRGHKSLRPVGVDLPPAPRSTLVSMHEAAVRAATLAAHQKSLRRIVIGAVGACGLILVAAAGAQVARAGGASRSPATSATPPADSPASQEDTAEAPAVSSPDPAAATPSAAAPATRDGIVRITSPAKAGHVWLDGERLTEATTTVVCGPHQVRFGPKAKPRPVEVPCGGELHLSR